MSYGASREEWQHFNLFLGLTEDLLPVVSNPDAEISPDSKMKDKGKTPSRYNKAGKVAGIFEWTSYKATLKNILEWQENIDYGICIQTRNTRAIDIDIPDAEKSVEVVEFIKSIGYDFPLRRRSNSGKCLLAFIVKGELPKTVLKTEAGMIEFLANGQQFIAAGEHPSGVRYEWEGGLPSTLPEITVDQYQSLIKTVSEKFGIGDLVIGSLRKPKSKDVVLDDDMLLFLKDKGIIKGRGKDGSAYIDCPFKSEHTGDSGITATVYFPRGGRGYQKGHFKCLHAHCAGRTDDDFETALGYKENDFAVVVSSQSGTGEDLVSPPDLPPFQRNKMGAIFATVINVTMAVGRPDFCGWHVAYDEFKGEVVFSECGEKTKTWRPFHDTDYMNLRLTLERKDFQPVSKDMIRDAMYYVANENRIDTAIQWLSSLVWDGKPRVGNFMANYMKAEDNAYAMVVSLYTWTALAGRVMSPAVKADMLPIWEGDQGMGKSMAVAAIAPDPMYFTEISFMESEDKITRKIKGVVVAEISELRGLQTRDAETIKAFITRTHEKWVPKYVEAATTYPRRLLFIGTTNQTEILADETGNRRWLPIHVGHNNNIDVDGIKFDRDQLWAEGKELFKEHGVMWRGVQELASPEHEKYKFVDNWEDKISDWLDTIGVDGVHPKDKELRLSDILSEAIGMEIKHVKRTDQMRAAKVMKSLGWKVVVTRDKNKIIRKYVKD